MTLNILILLFSSGTMSGAAIIAALYVFVLAQATAMKPRIVDTRP